MITEAAGQKLQTAQRAYEHALEVMLEEFPDIRGSTEMMQTVEFKEDKNILDYFKDSLLFLLSGLLIFWVLFRGLWFVIVETARDIQAIFDTKRATIDQAAKSREARRIQHMLLEVLWARDYIQLLLDDDELSPYEIRRDTLQYVVEHDDVLDEIRRRAIELADLDLVKLRQAQPTPPPPKAWWWFLDRRRARRVRQLNAFWFVAAMLPALAGIILITLLTQRLAVDGLDVLSSASLFAEIILGSGAVLAGRELLNAFFVDRSSGRSWQGEIAFVLASVFLIVIAAFYYLVPPAAAEVYNWFGQQAIEAGNATEAELYLESAARLDPDPHAASYVEVGCLYLTLGAPERAENVFERGLEADSRLLLARYHLAEIYIDDGNEEIALQLIEDGLNLLDRNATEDAEPFLPQVEDDLTARRIQYLLFLSFGHAYLETDAFQQAKENLKNAQILFDTLEPFVQDDDFDNIIQIPCRPNERLDDFIDNTELDLTYFRARTFDALCDVDAAHRAWDLVVRGNATTTRQEAYLAEANIRLNSGPPEGCVANP